MYVYHTRSISVFPFFLLRSFFFNDSPTTEIYPLSLHDALPIFSSPEGSLSSLAGPLSSPASFFSSSRSEEHTSELQSHVNLVCLLLLEKKKRIPVTDILFRVVKVYAYRVLVKDIM